MIVILLPAYNEAESLHRVLPSLAKALDKLEQEYLIVICDDGSTDETGEIAKKYVEQIPLVVLKHEINRGLGETIRDLFEYVIKIIDDEDIIIRLDCDNTHDPKYISQMVKKISQGYDVVIASRFFAGGGQHGLSKYRQFISKLANLFMKMFFPIPGIQEYSCGFRAYRASCIKKAIKFYGNNFIQLKGLGFTCTLEKLVKLRILGAKFSEIPFELRYDQKKSKSKMISSLTTYGYFTLAICYYWPFGGWRSGYKRLLNHTSA